MYINEQNGGLLYWFIIYKSWLVLRFLDLNNCASYLRPLDVLQR